MKNLNLDVDSPDKVIPVLRNAIEAYYQSSVDLQGAWQDKGAGEPWKVIAQELERTISRLETKLNKLGF